MRGRPITRRISLLLVWVCSFFPVSRASVHAAPDLPLERLAGTTVLVLLDDGSKRVGTLSAGSSEGKDVIEVQSLLGTLPLPVDRVREVKQVSIDAQQRAALLAHVAELNDGSLYQGELVTYRPDKELVLKLATGSVERIPVEQIRRMYSPAPTTELSELPSDFLRRRILLRDGSIITAELIVFIPNLRLVIRTATGEIRIYSREDVLVVETPKNMPPTTAASPVQTRTYLEAPDGFVLQKKSEEVVPDALPETGGPVVGRSPIAATELKQVHGEWRALCGAPCGLWLSAADTYRVVGGDLTGSPFQIQTSRSTTTTTITASVKGASPPLLGVGSVLVIGGGLTAFVGATLLAFGSGTDPIYYKGPAIALASGLPAVIVGAVMISRGRARIVLTQKPGLPGL